MGARFTAPPQDTQPDPVVKTDEQARKHRDKLTERQHSDLDDTVEVVQNEDGDWVVPDEGQITAQKPNERKKKCARRKAQTPKQNKTRKKKNGRKMPREEAPMAVDEAPMAVDEVPMREEMDEGRAKNVRNYWTKNVKKLRTTSPK